MSIKNMGKFYKKEGVEFCHLADTREGISSKLRGKHKELLPRSKQPVERGSNTPTI